MKIKTFVDKDDSPQVDLTPLIDVVFILLIFFILSANFQKESTIQVDRPSASSSVQSEATTLTVSIDNAQTIWFNGKAVSLSELQFQLKEKLTQETHSNAIINADQHLDTGTLISVIDAVRLSGISNVAIATQDK